MDTSIISQNQLISFISNAVYACRVTRLKLICNNDVDLSDIDHSELCERIRIAHDNLLAISHNLVNINNILRMCKDFDICKDPLFQE